MGVALRLGVGESIGAAVLVGVGALVVNMVGMALQSLATHGGQRPGRNSYARADNVGYVGIGGVGMGARGSGRKAAPVAILAAGRLGGGAVVDVPPLKLRPPAGTPAPVAAIFRRLVRELRDNGLLHALDVYLLAQLATALHINAEAAAQLAREGATYSDPMHAGRPAKHPAWQVWRESAATARALSALFGLSPVDRQRMIGAPDNGGGLVDVLRVLADE